jgi:ribose transport system substrate-binding protein
MSYNMKSLRIVVSVAAAFALPFLVGCPQSSGGRIKVAFVTNNADPFWNIAQKGVEKAAKDFDVDCVVKKPQGDASDQKKIIDSLLNQDIKAMAVSVTDPENQGRYFNEVSQKVKLFTQDNDTLQDDPERKTGRLCYIGTSNYAAGRAAGRLVEEAMPDGGEIAIFVGNLASLNSQQRKQGVLDELAGMRNAKGPQLGKYHLHADVYTDMPEKEVKARANALNAITKLQAQIDAGTPVCFIGLWAYNPPAILGAVKDKGVLGKVKIVAFDENDATLDGILDGHIIGTVVQQPYEFGYQSVRLMAAVCRGDNSVIPANGILDVPHFIVTKDGKSFATKQTKTAEGTIELPKLSVEGKTVEFWKADLKEKTGQ